MSATPIFDNYNEITSLVKLIKPDFDFNIKITPEKLEAIMKGHVSYYGLNPPDTSVNFIGSNIPGINHNTNDNNNNENSNNNINNINNNNNNENSNNNINNINNNNNNNNNNNKISMDRYSLKNGDIVNNNATIQNIIKKQSSKMEDYCCKLH
ncbi:hypothetical protein BCR36DRAFT_339561, partial [Piromyces finnis]